MKTRTIIGAASMLVVGVTGPVHGVELVDVRITGTVASNEFTRGPWQNAQVGDADIADDGVVNFADLLLLLSAWGACP